MKKVILMIYVITICIFCVFLSSCELGILYNDDSTVGLKNLEKFVDCLEQVDKNAIKALFAPNIVKQTNDIDDQIDELFQYYKGTYISDSASGGIGSGDSYEYGIVVKHLEMLYDIQTTTLNYHIGIQWYTQDDYDENNVGIWSLYIESYIKDSDWTTIEEWEIGIHIREPRE